MSLKNLADCIERIARDPVSGPRPAARETTTGRVISYTELRDRASLMAANLKLRFPSGTRPLCLKMHRSIDWYVCYIACARACIPVVSASKDLPDKEAETKRFNEIVNLLEPLGLIVDSDEDKPTFAGDLEMPVITFSELHDVNDKENREPSLNENRQQVSVPLSYHFTGGTTAAAKCVVISHEMAVHEIDTYPTILPSYVRWPETVLQNTSTYWPASAFGQLDIAIALKACAVLTVSGGSSAEEVSDIVQDKKIECIGVVPSVLRSLDPDTCSCLSLVFTWGEALPKSVAAEWCNRVDLIDLLIATEYWLSFFAIISNVQSGWTYKATQNTKILLEGERDILWISGPMVTPGYVGAQGGDRFKTIENHMFFCTNDAMVTTDDRSSFRYKGRIDQLEKIGGKFVDLLATAEEIAERVGRMYVDECCLVRDQEERIHAVFVLNQSISVNALVLAARKSVPTIQARDVHVFPTLPRKSATGKLDIGRLSAIVSDASMASPQYTFPDSQVPRGKLLALPNPHRYMWMIVIILVLCVDWMAALAILLENITVFVTCCVNRFPLWCLLRLPFVSRGLHALTSVPKMKKLMTEFPGDHLCLSLFLVAAFGEDEQLLSPAVRLLALLGDICVIRSDLNFSDRLQTATKSAAFATCLTFLLSSPSPAPFLLVALSPLLISRMNKISGFVSSVVAEIVLYKFLDSGLSHAATALVILGIGGLHGIKRLLSYILIYYVTVPFDLPMAWANWWRHVPTYFSVILYYAKKVDGSLGHPAALQWVSRSYRFLSTCWSTHTSSGYQDTCRNSWSERRFACDNCGNYTMENEGAYDRFGKFDKKGWMCETCWWGTSYEYPRIGSWSSDWMSGKLWGETRPSSDKKCDERLTSDPGSSGIAKQCVEALEALGLVEVDQQFFSGISSLLRIAIHEELKKRIDVVRNVTAMKLFENVNCFSDLVSAVSNLASRETTESKIVTDSDGAGVYKIPFAGEHLWENGACDWVLKYQCDDSLLSNAEAKWTQAIQALVKIHPALRARPLDDLSWSWMLQQAICLSPLWLKKWVMRACFQLWPRVSVAPYELEDSSLPISFEYVDRSSYRQSYILKKASRHRAHNQFKPPFEVVVYLPAERETVNNVYIYIRVTHLFADGFSVNSIVNDLDAFFRGSLGPETMNAFRVLEDRLVSTLLKREKLSNSVNLCSQLEEVTRDKALVQVLWLQQRTVKSFIELSRHLGVPMEVVMTGLVIGSLANKLSWKKLPLSIMHAQRDGIDEGRMLGYFSDYKDMGFVRTDTSYTDLFHQVATKLRNREWRAHSNDSLYDHSVGRHAWDASMFPVSFNILPRARQSRDALIENVETYWRAGPRFGQSECRLIHVYMEETRLDSEWAVRLHLNKRLFNCEWIVDYVCRVFDNSLKTVLSDPTRSILSDS